MGILLLKTKTSLKFNVFKIVSLSKSTHTEMESAFERNPLINRRKSSQYRFQKMFNNMNKILKIKTISNEVYLILV